LRIVENLEKILGIEMLTASQGFDFRKPLKSGILLEETQSIIRKYISFADSDRIFSDDIESAINLLKSKEIIRQLNQISSYTTIEFKNEDHELFGIY